jgi:hypothetical protein
VTTKQAIAVSEWSQSQSPVIAKQPRGRRFVPPGLLGFAGTLILHGFALQTALVAGPHKMPPPEVPELGSSPKKVAGKPAERLVFVDLPSSPNTDRGGGNIMAWVKLSMNMTPAKVDRLELPPPQNVDTLPLDEEKESESSSTNDEGAELARLYGIYSGQIQARVERIWSRPRTPVNEGAHSAKAPDVADYFHCQVQIAQDSTGNVQEVVLLNCNGTPAWQHSLVVAIQQASPLPAPPSPKVFIRTLSLDFSGYPYVAGGSAEGYENATSELAQVIAPARTPEEIADDFLPFRAKGSKQHQ